MLDYGHFFVWILIESQQSILQNFFNRHLSIVIKGFDVLLSGRAHHIGLTAFFSRELSIIGSLLNIV